MPLLQVAAKFLEIAMMMMMMMMIYQAHRLLVMTMIEIPSLNFIQKV